jgi:hypothetical protein
MGSVRLSQEDLDLIDSLLQDDDDELLPLAQENPTTSMRESARESTSSRLSFIASSPSIQLKPGEPFEKCRELYVGGTRLALGITIAPTEPRCCSNIACIHCDHVVVRFADARWKDFVNPLFLRNNYPQRLSDGLFRQVGWCAFGCQCTFCEEFGPVKLSPVKSNWVCRGHPA